MNSRIRLLLSALAATSAILAACAPGALGASPRWLPVAVTGPTVLPLTQSETQRLYVDAESGTYTLTFGTGVNEATTSPISATANASAVESALNSLSSIGGAGASVQVSGGPGGPSAEVPYAVTFGGALSDTNVPQMKADPSLLVGAGRSAAVSTLVLGGPGTSALNLYVQNIGGGLGDSSQITYQVTLPSGVSITKGPDGHGKWTCGGVAGDEQFMCTSNAALRPVLIAESITVPITADPGVQSGLISYEVSGGGAPSASGTLPLTVSAVPAGPGIQSFSAGAYDENGNSEVRAGSHPFSASTAIFANTTRAITGAVIPSGELRDLVVDLPPGFLGNPIAVPQCPESTREVDCPLDTIVGVAQIKIGGFDRNITPFPVFNTEAPVGYPAKYRFNAFNLVPLAVVGDLRSDEDYGLTASSLNTPPIQPLYGTFFTFLGSPADSAFDSLRCREIHLDKECQASSVPKTALLTLASNCAEQAAVQPVTPLSTAYWQFPGIETRSVMDIPPVTGCENLAFDADFTFEPSSASADSPASFRTSLTLPADGLTDPSKLSNPPIKNAVVDLPEGVTLNPSAADGLGACSLVQIGFKGTGFEMPNPIRFSRDPQSCPDSSKIGTGELKTELLETPLKGDLYLAAQGDGNPYGSLFAIYLVIEDPRHGIFIKLPARVDPDERTGQMRVTFQNLPQIPFTRLDLTLKGGDRSALASPTTCGEYVTIATNTPWSYPESGPPTVSANGFQINQGPNGLPCAPTKAERPFDIGWNAGAESAQAGASGPFHMKVTRPDGSQELTGLDLKTPKGVSASLKGIPQCSDAQIEAARKSTGKQELSNSACPAASKVGTLTTGAGSGPSPFYVSGNLYLAGPYRGAPLSVVAVTPAVAGPFDLGNVVVRNAVKIDRTTAQVAASSDEIPQILKGVALRIRDVRIKLDRKNWTINSTSCEPGQVELSAKGANGASANRSARFQVSGCSGLGFKPRLTAKVVGGTKRGKHPAFEANLTYPEGSYANLKDVQVTLPHSEFLDQAHINTICTRVQAAANACPAGAIYGFAEATTPLLDGKLTGPVFLKSSVHKLPDLAIALKGPDDQPIEVEFQGRIDSVKAQIRNTIEGLPDVPVSSFTLKMKGGKKGLLVNSRNLCKGKPGRLTVKMAGQNNKSFESRPRLGNSCGKKGQGNRGKGKK